MGLAILSICLLGLLSKLLLDTELVFWIQEIMRETSRSLAGNTGLEISQ